MKIAWSRTASWLALAAAPTFGVMALATALQPANVMLCGAAQSTSPLGGMTAMYLLMSAFHTSPWLSVLSKRGAPPP